MSRVTSRNPNPAPHSEEELLEQWDFLDRLVERQAAQLRAGIQDTEEVDEPAIGAAELEGLRREVARLRTDLRAAQAAREAAEAELRRSGEALISLTASQRNLDEEERSRERALVLERAAATWRERAEAAERALGSAGPARPGGSRGAQPAAGRRGGGPPPRGAGAGRGARGADQVRPRDRQPARPAERRRLSAASGTSAAADPARPGPVGLYAETGAAGRRPWAMAMN